MSVELDVPHPLLLRPEDGEGEPITDKPHRELRLLVAHPFLTYGWYRYAESERGADPHVHHEHSDAFYVLDGQISLRLGPDLEPLTATAGTLVAIPPGVVHAFDNDGPGEARFLNFHAPDGGFANYLRTRDETGFDSSDPPDGGGRPASDAIVTRPGEGERFDRGDRTNTILGALPEISFFYFEVTPAWTGIPTHQDEEVDTWFVLEGEASLVVGDDVVIAEAGTFYGATPGARHGVRNDRAGQAVFLNVHAPDLGFADRVRRG